MSDLIERLRARPAIAQLPEMAEAADEIERLQARVEALEGVKDAAKSFVDGEGWESVHELNGALEYLAATEQEGET